MTNLSGRARLPTTMGYFRLILRCYGDTPERRAALLAGTGIAEKQLRSPGVEISLFQQIRQMDNATALCGESWVIDAPELWNSASHGSLGIAILTAPTIGDGLNVLKRYAGVRVPFYRLKTREHAKTLQLDIELAIALKEEQWRPLVEICFLGFATLLAAVLGRKPHEAEIAFACRAPHYAGKMRAALGGRVAFDARGNTMTIPKSWFAIESPFADAALFANAVSELQRGRERIDEPGDLRARVERLLQTMPDGRLSAVTAARAMGVSQRTLVRRLAQAGTGFRTLLDRELRERAGKLLQSRLSRTQIAEQLGYEDPASFNRACRRWFKDGRRTAH